jgi:hypothetical protein
MEREELLFCDPCANGVLGGWKGWPHRDAVPRLPRVISGVCEACGGSAGVRSSSIAWLNYHSAFSTGLPEYWLLVVVERPNKWGYPYFASGQCPTCSEASVVSEMRYPNGEHELKHNCGRCGVTSAAD